MIGARSALTPEQWKRVRDIYDRVLSEPAERRPSAAARLCGGDSQLASEVNLLIAASDHAGSFLGEPAVAALGLPATDVREEVVAGSILAGRFRILRFLNRGGMGEVYEAWDSDLREVVALKTIRADIASEPAAIQYFKDEVKNARRVSHSNICRVYDLFSHAEDGGERLWFLTMQFLEGQTLLEHVRESGPFETVEALPLIEQMVAGLSAAHDLGVVHRDFKSANVMLVPVAGKLQAVITDFGLATRVPAEGPGKQGPRRQGTPEYASPEQWREGIAGPAADQYALGIVICEMVTGERPRARSFEEGEDAVQPPVELPAGRKLEPRWASVVRRCLEIKPEDRFKTVADILPALDPQRHRKTALGWIAAVVVLPIVAAVTVLFFANAGRNPAITGLEQVTPAMSLSANPSLSRDGKTIAYMSDRAEAGNPDIWVQQLPDGTPVRITTDPATDDYPSLSPDGGTVVFRSDREPRGVYISDANGGGERLLVPEGREPKFSPDGRSIIYWTGDDKETFASGRIYWLDLAAGKPVQLATDFIDARNPVWSSDGRHVLFNGCQKGSGPVPACADWWVTDPSGTQPHATGAAAILRAAHIRPRRVYTGWYGDKVLFSGEHGADVQLWELELPSAKMTARGTPRPVVSGDMLKQVSSSSLAGDILAFTQLSPAVHVWRLDHASGPKLATASKVTQHAEYDFSPSISSNGRWLAFARGLGSDRKIWLRDMVLGKEVQVFTEGADKLVPLTDDAGTTIAYESWENGVPSIYLAKPGKGEEKICSSCRNPTGWFNSKDLLYSNADMSQVEMYDTATRQSRTILSLPGTSLGEASWSQQNQFLLFTASLNHGQRQIFAAHFPVGAKTPDHHWIPITAPSVSSDKPRWSGDGKSIFYFSNLDNYGCVWGQHFDSARGEIVGKPFAIQHYHSLQFSPAEVSARSFNLSAAGDSIYLNAAEMNGTIWTGKLARTNSILGGNWF